MKRIARGVFVENKYRSVHLGAIVTSAGVMLVDSPLRLEDGRLWLAQLADHGQPAFLVLMDHNPDRVLGARGFTIPRVAHQVTRQTMMEWSDTFKGSAHPIGADADSLKRITGVSEAVPEICFSEEMVMHLGDRQIHFWHRPGPTAGSMWLLLPEVSVVFIGDTVATTEPPYLRDADIPAWLDSLDELRSASFSDHKLVSARNGVVDRTALNDMARFLRRVDRRIRKLTDKGAEPEEAAASAKVFIKSYKVPASREQQMLLRLQAGMAGLYTRLNPPEE
ncbi:MAG: hypothetical protein PVJ07_06845 [Anaerolineales bacterium]|jgi:glyoxylase-like metal-dependent hydrolase (beta-lactamase superfamily II)